jgi:hypothetical protein
VELEPHLTRVTSDAVEELSIEAKAIPADDDALMMISGELTRVGRRGVVGIVPLRAQSPAQSPQTLLPSGDGAMAFWSELAPALDAQELRVTRFTSTGVDPAVHDRVLGRGVLALASDGTNILLSDGRVIDASARVLRTLTVPPDPVAAAWDGREWLIATGRELRRGEEVLPIAIGWPAGLACSSSECVLAWAGAAGQPGALAVEALRIARDRPLGRARRLRVATDVLHKTVAVEATRGAILVMWPDSRSRSIFGRVAASGRPLSPPRLLEAVQSATDSTFFDSGSAPGAFLLVHNAWPLMRVLRIDAAGRVTSTAVLQNGTARGVVQVGTRTLVLYERKAPEPPWSTTERAFARFAE